MTVEIRFIPGDELPRLLGIYGKSDELLALVPTPAYGDVQSILDTVVPLRVNLIGRRLEIALNADPAGVERSNE